MFRKLVESNKLHRLVESLNEQGCRIRTIEANEDNTYKIYSSYGFRFIGKHGHEMLVKSKELIKPILLKPIICNCEECFDNLVKSGDYLSNVDMRVINSYVDRLNKILKGLEGYINAEVYDNHRIIVYLQEGYYTAYNGKTENMFFITQFIGREKLKDILSKITKQYENEQIDIDEVITNNKLKDITEVIDEVYNLLISCSIDNGHAVDSVFNGLIKKYRREELSSLTGKSTISTNPLE